MRISVAHGTAALVSSCNQGERVAEQKKSSGFASGLLTFAPWILYGFASGFNHWRVASGGGLILCIVSLGAMRSRGVSIKLMDWTMLTFFVIASVLTIGLRSTTFPVYNAVVVWSCFALAAWGSVAIGRPFTAAYARENAPPEFWSNPIFVRLMWIMTLVWCGLMTVNVGFAAIGVIIGGKLAPPLFGFAMPTVLLICGFVFNSRFPADYLARAGVPVGPQSAPISSAGN
jgi:intracellular septation protein A